MSDGPNSKLFSISSILSSDNKKENETDSEKEIFPPKPSGISSPAVVSKLELPVAVDLSSGRGAQFNNMAATGGFSLHPLPAWYHWYTAGQQFLHHLHQENLNRK